METVCWCSGMVVHLGQFLRLAFKTLRCPSDFQRGEKLKLGKVNVDKHPEMLGNALFLSISEVNLFILKHFIFLLILFSGRSYKGCDSELGCPTRFALLFQKVNI